MERYRAGSTVKELACAFDISRETVGQHLNRRGVERRVQGLQPEDVPQAAELYRTGWSLAKLGEKFGTAANTVRTRLLEVGVKMREPWEQ